MNWLFAFFLLLFPRDILAVDLPRFAWLLLPSVASSRVASELWRYDPLQSYPLGHPIRYHPDEKKQIDRIQKKLGLLYIDEGKDETLEITRPWAGYWYPLSDRVLYEGHTSPLAKLDQYLTRHGITSHIREKDTETFGTLPPEMWEGFCHSWAFASVLTPEPKHALFASGIHFSIADQKGLRTRLFERPVHDLYGLYYLGTAETDGTYQDMRPEGFHQLAVSLLRNATPFVMDQDAGVQVWSKPVFRIRYRTFKDSEIVDSIRVRMEVVFSRERNRETNEPTTIEDTAMKIYHYRLYLDPNDKNVSGYRVLFGEWLAESYVDHPDAVMVPVPMSAARPITSNADINTHIDTVLRLLNIF